MTMMNDEIEGKKTNEDESCEILWCDKFQLQSLLDVTRLIWLTKRNHKMTFCIINKNIML